ncbi:unnamed protein product [Cuscuta campestris]|uniref:Rapid alkalinization factor 1 n=1 Tax=Cuscuta campestris TaxID=132261 RepID=A0A484LSH7_9ASTE|nr:unnamed protein product [Cuscuta campestris]
MAKKLDSVGFLKACKILIIAVLFSAAAAVGAAGGVYEIGYFPMSTTSASSKICEGSIGDCVSADEFELDSESNRRILAYRRKYISYSALRQGTIPCNRRGVSYYSCHTGAEANPYMRGCNRITRCRG